MEAIPFDFSARLRRFRTHPEERNMLIEEVREVFERGKPVRFNNGTGHQIARFDNFTAFEDWWKQTYAAK